MRSAITRTDRYSNGAIWFHWIIALAIIVNLALVLMHENVLDGVRWVMPVHKSLGLTVLVLSLARLGWRIANPVPPMPATMTGWERLAAQVTHWGFYALMIGVPIGGWAMVSGAAVRRPLTWFGLFDVPYLPVSKEIGDLAHEGHEIFGLAMLGLVIIHVLAALRHHFMVRDNVLARMLPIIAPKG